MKREIMVGNFCQRCEAVLSLHRLDCSCLRDVPAHAAERWRKLYWKPLYWKAEVTMKGVNRG
jgi:hypothetical protein